MVTLAVLVIGIVGVIGTMTYIARSIGYSRSHAVANNLLQEKIEYMKAISYYRLVTTTSPVTSTESGITPFLYDNSYYSPESLNVAGIDYIRRVYVDKVLAGTGGGLPVAQSALSDDTGLKRIQVYVLWQDEGRWKRSELDNLINNPSMRRLTGTINGTVTSTMTVNLAGVSVSVVENASWFSQTASNGGYSFKVSPGTYSLVASTNGYFDGSIQNIYVGASSTYTWSPQMSRMSSGTVTGFGYIRDHLVLSRMVGNLDDGGFAQEFVEVYNPTTYTWTMSGASGVGLQFQRRPVQDPSPIAIDIVYNTASIAPGGFYLFANKSPLNVNGTFITADATWDTTLTGLNDSNFAYFDVAAAQYNVIPANGVDGGGEGEGSLRLYSKTTNATQDIVGWRGGGMGQSPGMFETAPLPETNGIEDGEMYYRYSSTNSAITTLQGPGWDTGANSANWGVMGAGSWNAYPPRNSLSAVQTNTTGTPAEGAYVSSNDGLSSPVLCNSSGAFTLTAVATGTWYVSFSSGVYYYQVSTTIVTNGQSVSVANVGITSTTNNGFVTGTVYRSGIVPLSGIIVQGMSNNVQATTGANGRYLLIGDPGVTDVIANAGNFNLNYISMSSAGVSVGLGQYTSGIDFYLSSGGRIKGNIKVGVNPLPDVPVTASSSSVIVSEGVSDSNGNFTIPNLSTGTYYVELQLEQGESYSPSASNVTLTSPGVDVFSASYTVTNAFGWISGTARSNGNGIETGVLVIATTATLTGSPPTVDATLRSGVATYYQASTLADGSYRISLPGGSSGAVNYNVYGWYTTYSGGTATTSRNNTTAAVMGGVETTGVNLSW